MNRSRLSFVNAMTVVAAMLFGSQAVYFYADSAATVRRLAELNATGPRQAVQERTGRASHGARGPRGSGGFIELETPRSGPIEISCPAGRSEAMDPCSPYARRSWDRDVVTVTWVDLRVGLFETLVHRPLRIVAGSRTVFETSLDDTLASEWRGARRSMWLMPTLDVLMAAFLAVMALGRMKRRQPIGGRP